MKIFSKNNINKYVKTITVYTLPSGFIIEADKCEEVTDFYIYHKDYGIKMLMFGLCNDDTAEQEEILYVNAPQYMDIYKDKYMD
ncbi:MAG: hypothetical protein IKI94_09200 [Ruminococcus sp.]|nr:hypothetical protein [Ruminococcus sp.]